MENLPIYPNKATPGGIPLTGQGKDAKQDLKKLEKACSDFEAIFIQQMLQSMRKTVTSSGFLENGLGKGIYESLFDAQLSQCLAKREKLGIGRMIYNQMIRHEQNRSAGGLQKGEPGLIRQR